MDSKTPDRELSGGLERFNAVLINLRELARMTVELKEEISQEWDRVKRDHPEAQPQKLGSLVKSDINALIKLLMQQEHALNEFDKSRTGRTEQTRLDLDAARLEIGSRLDRLRRAADTGKIP
ncbi:MAG: hypothetical protein AAGA12_13515 [Pseudomonadota bacterium]